MCNGVNKLNNILKLTFIMFLMFSCNANKTLPTVSSRIIEATEKLAQDPNKNHGNLFILLFGESIVDYTVCLDNQFIGIIGPNTRADLILADGTHNLIIGIKKDLVGYSYEANPCGPRPHHSLELINRNIIIKKGKNYIYDIKKNPNWGGASFVEYFYEINNKNIRYKSFRPVISYVDTKINTKKNTTVISKPKKIIDNQINLSTARKECADLGFKEKSEKFGECVMELIK